MKEHITGLYIVFYSIITTNYNWWCPYFVCLWMLNAELNQKKSMWQIFLSSTRYICTIFFSKFLILSYVCNLHSNLWFMNLFTCLFSFFNFIQKMIYIFFSDIWPRSNPKNWFSWQFFRWHCFVVDLFCVSTRGPWKIVNV